MAECARCAAAFDHLADEWVHASLLSHRAGIEDTAFSLCANCGADARAFLAGGD